MGCESLTDITLPDSIKNISVNAFSYCSNLTNVTLPNGIQNIASESFANCIYKAINNA